MRVVITSTNPVKRNAAKKAFALIFPETLFDFQEISVPSGVREQPISEEETLQGAKNRVANAIKQIPGAEFYIGMEGGVELKKEVMESFAWIFIQRKDGKTGTGRTGTFFLPKKLSDLILKGTELGQADDIVFGQNNTKQKMGTVGVLTKNVIDRTEYYKQAVIFALIPFINPELY